MAATSGRGVDVVLNSLTGELLRDSLDACAKFGRFVEIGRRDINEHGRLDMAIFRRNISVTAFDLSDLFYSSKSRHHNLWQRYNIAFIFPFVFLLTLIANHFCSLLSESIQLFRSGRLKYIHPLKVFDASQTIEAFRHFSSSSRTGKVTVSFENEHSMMNVRQ